MGGKKTTVVDTAPQATTDARKKLSDMLFGGGSSKFNPGGIGRGAPGNSSGGGPIPGFMAAGPQEVSGTNIMTAGPVSTKFNSGGDIDRGMVRDVNAGAAVTSRDTQSTDQLGGANSEFFKNMMGQLNPMFSQQRAEGLAAAKESAGSLTGSGFANRLGASVNRSLGQEQATAANFASQAIGMEQQRQQADAGRSLSAAQGNQQAGLVASQANQGADQGFVNSMLQRNSQGLQAQQLGLQAETQNQNTTQQQNLSQAELEQRRKLQQQALATGVGQSNASNFANLIGQQASIGAGANTVQQSGGFASVLGGIAGTALGSFAGPLGSAAGAKLGSSIFGG